MYIKLLKNDIRKKPWNNVILFLFMSLSVLLAVSVSLVLVQLFTSISTMYETAKPPHFLQMHKGEVVQEEIDDFNRNYPQMEYWQTVSMIDVYGENLTIVPSGNGGTEDTKTYTLSDCRLDISLVKQNESHDVLLDAERNKLTIAQGEIGVPVILLEKYRIGIGDTLILTSGNTKKAFLVSDYVYDGQMNSTLCSSTRFLISDRDFDDLFGTVGETEYLIEAYFMDSALASDYQTAYEQSEKDLPKNGQAVTYPMIFLLSAMTDLIMAMIFLLIGILLIVIALICLRYTILAQMEEEMKEIGTMKALGIPGNGIRELYLGKIRILMAAGCVFGTGSSFLLTSVLTGHMSRTFGEQSMGVGSFCAALGVCIVIYGIVVIFAGKVLGRLRKASVTDLLVTEKGFGKKKRSVKDGIHRAKHLSVNWLLGLREVRHGYGIVFGLLFMVSFLMVVPYRMVKTMEDESFITYMGSPVCDVLLEVEQGTGLTERKNEAERLLTEELAQGNVSDYEITKRVRLQAVGSDGSYIGIHIDSGIRAGNGLRYLTGEAPKTDTEIALSVLMAEEMEKTTGDTVTLIADGKEQNFCVSGIYQDVTSGGRTAKAVCGFETSVPEQYTFLVNFSGEKNERSAKDQTQRIEEWRKRLGTGYSIENMEEFVRQTLGGVSTQAAQGAYAACLIGIGLTALILTLFLKLRIAGEMNALAAKQAIGISFTAIVKQELYPVLFSGGFGIVAGIFLAEFVGDRVISIFFSALGIGIKRIEFSEGFVGGQLVILVVLFLTLTAVTCLACRPIRKIRVADHCNE